MKAKSELGGNVETPAETTGAIPILDKLGEPIDPIWAAEFRGFFWGEGTLAIQCARPWQARKPDIHWNGYSIAVTASIGLRSDDSPVLQEFQRRLGGQLRLEPYSARNPANAHKTITRWAVGTAADNWRIGLLLESSTGLPFNKARQLAIWREAVSVKLAAGATSGSRYTEEAREYMQWAWRELQRLRRWDR